MGNAESDTYEEIHTLDEVLTELEKHVKIWCSIHGSSSTSGNNLLMPLRRQ